MDVTTGPMPAWMHAYRDVGGRAASGTSGREKSRAFGELSRVDGLIQSFLNLMAEVSGRGLFGKLLILDDCA